MNPSAQNTITLEIGLSKEDQDRIAAVRTGGAAGGKRKKRFQMLRDLNEMLVGLTRIKIQEKVTFYQLLSVMINAGVPLIRSLYVLSGQSKNPRFKRVIHKIAADMEAGASLSVAMESHERIFKAAERGMIASGEASGNLNAILQDLSKQSEKSAQILAKVKGAMAYPAAIILIMIVALFLMLTLVVPKITEMFAESGKELPRATEILISVSEFTQNYWELMALGSVTVVLGLALASRTRKGKYGIDFALLYVPVFGKLVRKLMISRFARMLASLMKAGIPIVKALEINAEAVGNRVYKRRIEFAAQDVAQGIPLGENLSSSEFLFSPMVASMILVGEQTAKVDEVATKIADYYEDEVDNTVESLSKLMEPVILVIMGSIVGFIVAAIMQPIMSLSDVSGVI